MSDRSPHDKDAALKVSISAAISLAIMIVEFVWLIRDEVKFVWPKLRASWMARIYVLTRYLGIASQIFNVSFTVRMYHGVYTSPAGCHLWFSFQALVVQSLLIFVEGLLMHRLYALFLRDRLILVVLISFAISQMASMGVSAGLAFPSNKHTVTCLLMASNPGSAFFSAATIVTNLLIFLMTFWRYFRLPKKWTQHGLGRIVLRDSAFSLSAITMMMMFLTLCSLQVIRPAMSGNITYYWLVCVLWISIGRLIVNHEKVARDEGEQGEGSTWRGTLQLTSQIEMGQSELSLDTLHGSSDGHAPISDTFRSSRSTPMTKASQLSPSVACAGDSASEWLGDHSPTHERGRQHSPQPSNTKLPVEASIPNASRFSLSKVCAIEGDAPQTEDHPQADADANGRVRSPSPSPQPSSSEPPLATSDVSS